MRVSGVRQMPLAQRGCAELDARQVGFEGNAAEINLAARAVGTLVGCKRSNLRGNAHCLPRACRARALKSLHRNFAATLALRYVSETSDTSGAHRAPVPISVECRHEL